MFPKEILQSLLFGTNRKKNAPNGQITWDFVAQMSHYGRAKGVINIYENYEFSTISSINIERMMPESATEIFQNALQKHKFYLLTYFFLELIKNNNNISPILLPTLLEYCSEHPKLNILLHSVMGEAGKKLADLHPVWNNWYSDDDILLNDLSKEQKLQFFRRLRKQNPSEASRLLKQIFPNEPPTFKTESLKIIQENLQKSDLNLLFIAYEDKNANVKAIAQPLLISLGELEISERLEKYFSEFVYIHRGKIFVKVPNAVSSELKKDGFSDKLSPQEWFYRLFSSVSPQFIEKFFQTEGADLLALLLESQYADSAIGGYAFAIKLRKDHTRAAQLLAAIYAQKSKTLIIHDIDLFAVLEIKEAEKLADYYFTNLPIEENYQYHPLSRLMCHYPHEWSMNLTQTFVKALQKIFLSPKAPRFGLYWEDEIAFFANKCPIDLVPKLQLFYKDETRFTPYWDRSVQFMQNTWMFRRNFFESLVPESQEAQ